MTFELHKYEKAVGPLFACQYACKFYVEDTTNDFTSRKYAETIYEWLGLLEGDVDELATIDYDKSVFIFKVLEKYNSNYSIKDSNNCSIEDSNLLLNYLNALLSLQYQITLKGGLIGLKK